MSRLGQIVAGRYRLLERIGAGAMGEVFRASDDRAKGKEPREVAVKILRPERSREREAVTRFLAEVAAMRLVRHPAIARIEGEGYTDDQVPFVAMELLHGESLRTTLQRHGRVDRATALSLIAPILEALAAAHDHGVIHRDIKPENVHLSKDIAGVVSVKVLDFGIAKVVDAALVVGHNTTAGMIVGTPGYFSPEQASGDRTIDGRADLFAVGAILFELLTGKRAFDGKSPVVIAWKVVTEAAPRLAAGDVGGVVESAADLQGILDRALAKKATDRYPSARAFLDAITPLAPSDIGRRVLLSSLLRASAEKPLPPVAPPPPDSSSLSVSEVLDGQMSKTPRSPEAAPAPFLATMKSSQDPLTARLDARAESVRRAVRFAEDSSEVETPALTPDPRDLDDLSLATSATIKTAFTSSPPPSMNPYSLPEGSRGKNRVRAGWVRSVVNGLERAHSVADVAAWIDLLPPLHATAIRVASLDPDTWTTFDALHALHAVATEKAFGGEVPSWRAHARTHSQDLAARLDRWTPSGALAVKSESPLPTWWAWWPLARAELFDVGSIRVEGARPEARSVIVQIDGNQAESRAIRQSELGLLEAVLARAGFASPTCEPLSGDYDFGQEFRYRVSWG